MRVRVRIMIAANETLNTAAQLRVLHLVKLTGRTTITRARA